jgi:hypothetical protein
MSDLFYFIFYNFFVGNFGLGVVWEWDDRSENLGKERRCCCTVVLVWPARMVGLEI